MSTTKTYIKAGLERTDSEQNIATYHSTETTISDKTQNQTFTCDPTLKLYVASSPTMGGMGGAHITDDQPSGVGKMILTLAVKFLSNETLMERPVRHYTTSVQTESSGCCGTGNTTMKSEVWMADVELPVFDPGAPKIGWKAACTSMNSKCKIDFQRKGDIEGYEAAQEGLALKSITSDEAGKPIFSTSDAGRHDAQRRRSRRRRLMTIPPVSSRLPANENAKRSSVAPIDILIRWSNTKREFIFPFYFSSHTG